MPETDYTIRHYLEGDEDQIIELLELVFGEFPKNETKLLQEGTLEMEVQGHAPRAEPDPRCVNG